MVSFREWISWSRSVMRLLREHTSACRSEIRASSSCSCQEKQGGPAFNKRTLLKEGNTKTRAFPTCLWLCSMALSSSRLAAEFSLRWICLRCSMEEAWRWLSSARSDAVMESDQSSSWWYTALFIHLRTITQWILHRWNSNRWNWLSCLCFDWLIKVLPSLAFPSSSNSKRNVCSSCSDCCLRMSRVLRWASFRAWTSSLCSCFKRSSKAWAEIQEEIRASPFSKTRRGITCRNYWKNETKKPQKQTLQWAHCPMSWSVLNYYSKVVFYLFNRELWCYG